RPWASGRCCQGRRNKYGSWCYEYVACGKGGEIRDNPQPPVGDPGPGGGEDASSVVGRDVNTAVGLRETKPRVPEGRVEGDGPIEVLGPRNILDAVAIIEGCAEVRHGVRDGFALDREQARRGFVFRETRRHEGGERGGVTFVEHEGLRPEVYVHPGLVVLDLPRT